MQLTWSLDRRTTANRTSLVGYLDDVNPDALERVSGLKATGDHAYYEPEIGYEGWDLFGTFDGEPFNLYIRYGTLKIGGTPNLDVDGLTAYLKKLVADV